ncbi:uncharacterized protein STEHIDRAFT_116240 [Stereum hirsutum FP-91666 SS1]|uniref:Uncharacterized protein n=1 Tax=Stereum hirsutum (strain FP-91666) TaxID=721885 RepID=R7RXX7_STEHR|nr:uncharacterized protein STEHIDRAFT_116240 [Stereum hirsutum FP-91666 SS1]EIM79750.1 hypothetical protein STEHIDRAFT_116240 [Stereum hirsutum FP-91666 SS1]
MKNTGTAGPVVHRDRPLPTEPKTLQELFELRVLMRLCAHPHSKYGEKGIHEEIETSRGQADIRRVFVELKSSWPNKNESAIRYGFLSPSQSTPAPPQGYQVRMVVEGWVVFWLAVSEWRTGSRDFVDLTQPIVQKWMDALRRTFTTHLEAFRKDHPDEWIELSQEIHSLAKIPLMARVCTGGTMEDLPEPEWT